MFFSWLRVGKLQSKYNIRINTCEIILAAKKDMFSQELMPIGFCTYSISS